MYILQQGSFAVHILGLIFWLGGLICLSRVLRVFVAPAQEGAAVTEGREEVLKACKALWYGFVLGGMLIVIASGTVQMSLIGLAYYMKQGWFHMKLTAVIVLFVVTGFTGLQMARLERGEALPRARLAMIHGLTAGFALIVLLITYLGRNIA